MKTGMLWFDNKGSLEERVKRAADYYQRKFGIRPTKCFVNPAEVMVERVGGIVVKVDRRILPMHIWMGEEEAKNAAQV